MNKTVVIVGGNAGALIVAEIFKNSYHDILFLETYAKDIDREKIIADKIISGVSFLKKADVDYFIATGDNKQRRDNFDIIHENTGKNPVNCIHPTAYISPSAKIGYGNLICPGSIIHTGAVIGNNTIINTGSIIEHNCSVGDFAQISPNTTLCGCVEVGKFSFIGAGSVVIPKIRIGQNSIIGAGASVIGDIGDSKLYTGVPAILKKELS